MEYAIIHDSDSELRRGNYGILQPYENSRRITPGENDFFIVPALCYDEKGTGSAGIRLL
jgi:5-formyltetrahydrofolate cyclo-ligase